MSQVTVRDASWVRDRSESLVPSGLTSSAGSPVSAPALMVQEQTSPLYLLLCCIPNFSIPCQSCPDLSLFFLRWQCWKSLRPPQGSTPSWLPCMAQTFIVALHRQKWGRCRDSKSMFPDTNCFHHLCHLLCAEIHVSVSVFLPSILFSLLAMITNREVLAVWVAKPNCLLLHTCFWIIATTREKQGQHTSVNANTISQHSPRHCVSDFCDF